MSDQAPHPDLAPLLRLADDTGLGVIRIGRGLTVTDANLAAHLLLDRRPHGLIGRTLMETFLDHRLEALVRAAAGGQAGWRETGSDDRKRIVVRARPASEGGAWVTLEDVTELRRLQRIRSEFVDNLSHELRTPLTNVRVVTELLMDDLASTDAPTRIRERVATIDVETGHLAQMIGELLDLSRIEQATAEVRRDEVPIGPLVSATLARLRTFADRQGVTLRAAVPDDLPAVRGDEERLGQLLVNLLHNAIKFSPRGGSVTVSARREGDSVIVAVEDQGEGIPRSEQDRVFERFYKVDRARQRGLGGTGLGLAIARHIAEAHGGRLWLESTEDVGSTFSFSVPVA